MAKWLRACRKKTWIAPRRMAKRHRCSSFISFTDDQVEKFKAAERITVGIAHEKYGHMSIMPEATKAALSEDFS